jgi:hypothetical protein
LRSSLAMKRWGLEITFAFQIMCSK